MALIVQKFGGSSVADAQKIQNICSIIAKTYDAGNNVVVVLSAQGDTTDDLIAKAGGDQLRCDAGDGLRRGAGAS